MERNNKQMEDRWRMVRLFLLLLIPVWSFGQMNRFQGFGHAPAAVGAVAISSSHNSANATNTITSVPAGALLVLCTGVNGNTATDCAVTSSPSLTWTKGADAGGTNTDNSEIWTAVYSAGGSITITMDWSQNEYYSTVFAVTNAEGTLGGTSGTQITGSAPSVTVTTTRANSILFGVTTDWNAVDGATRTIRDAATEDQYYHPSGAVTGYIYHKQATTTASHTLGYSVPTGQAAATAILEIRGN